MAQRASARRRPPGRGRPDKRRAKRPKIPHPGSPLSSTGEGVVFVVAAVIVRAASIKSSETRLLGENGFLR